MFDESGTFEKNQNSGGWTLLKVNQIISSLSHELRTPMSVVSSNIELLKNNPDLTEDLRSEAFFLCEEAISSVNRFIDDLQLLNSANKGELYKKPALFDVEKMVNQILRQANTIFHQSKRIIAVIRLSQPLFCSDEKLLSRIITGLIDNAYRFSHREVRVMISNPNGDLEVEISDEGFGIPAEELDMVFVPFYRCNNVKTISGNGLGLSIIEKAVAYLQGHITITSEISKGTTVKLIIPADDCPENTNY